MKIGKERMEFLGKISGRVEQARRRPTATTRYAEATGHHDLREVAQLLPASGRHVRDEHQAVDAYRVAQDSRRPLDRCTLRGREARRSSCGPRAQRGKASHGSPESAKRDRPSVSREPETPGWFARYPGDTKPPSSPRAASSAGEDDPGQAPAPHPVGS